MLTAGSRERLFQFESERDRLAGLREKESERERERVTDIDTELETDRRRERDTERCKDGLREGERKIFLIFKTSLYPQNRFSISKQ